MATTAKTLDTPPTGSNQNVWATNVLNPNFVKIDAAFGGSQSVALTNADVTLSSSEALNVFIACSGTLSADVAVIFPARGSFYIIRNDCTGAHTLTAETSAVGGATVIIPQGGSTFVYTDGTDMWTADGAAATGQLAYGVDSGVANAYVVTTPLGISLTAGVSVFWKATNANTAASTINVDGTGATAIKAAQSGADPIAGAIAAGGVYLSTYDGTVWRTAGLGAGNFGLYSADAGASAGPTLELYRDSASPAALDATGTVSFAFKDSGNNKTTGATIGGEIISPTDGAEYFSVTHYALTNGALQKELEVGDGLEVGSPTGGNLGFGTVNATGLYINSIPVGALVTLTASGGTELSYTSLVPGIYDIYFNNILVGTNGTDLGFRFSVGGVFITSGSYAYQGLVGTGTTPTAFGTGTTPTATSILIGTAFAASAAASMKGDATLIVGGATAGATSINGSYVAANSTGAFVLVPFGGENTTSSQIDGIRLFSPSGSTLTSGTMTIFRRA